MATPRNALPSPAPVRVLSVPDDIPIVVCFLGPVRGLDTHFKSGKSVPCPGPEECPTNLHRLGVIWRGYSAAELWEPNGRFWQPIVLEVTENLEEILRGRELRGQVWVLSRGSKGGKSAPVLGEYCETVHEPRLSEAFDVKDVLLRLFHVHDLRLGTRNPLPPRLVLPPVVAAPPNIPAELLPPEPKPTTPKEKEEIRKQLELFKRNGYRPTPEQLADAQKNERNGHPR